jgi:biopolymer transport protein ExbD
MKFRRRPRNDIAIELVPLVDVVLVLLLFFMVSTTFIRQSELKVICRKQMPRLSRPTTPSSRIAPTANTP